MTDQTTTVLAEIAAERDRQDVKWGQQQHPDGTGNLEQGKAAESARDWCKSAFGSGYGTWSDILAEEVAEANAERDPAKLRAELVQVAAVAVAWIEAIDRRNPATTSSVTAGDPTAAVLRIVSAWCVEANDIGGVDAGDLAFRLDQAGHPLPDVD